MTPYHDREGAETHAPGSLVPAPFARCPACLYCFVCRADARIGTICNLCHADVERIKAEAVRAAQARADEERMGWSARAARGRDER